MLIRTATTLLSARLGIPFYTKFRNILQQKFSAVPYHRSASAIPPSPHMWSVQFRFPPSRICSWWNVSLTMNHTFYNSATSRCTITLTLFQFLQRTESCFSIPPAVLSQSDFSILQCQSDFAIPLENTPLPFHFFLLLTANQLSVYHLDDAKYHMSFLHNRIPFSLYVFLYYLRFT